MKSPSKISVLTVKKAWWMSSSFKYIMLFGGVYTGSQAIADRFNKGEYITDKNHEMVHVRQAVSCYDSWVLYYIMYIWQWLCNIPLITVSWHSIYKFINFELEAYYKESDKIDNTTECILWKKHIPVSIKKTLAKEWNNVKKTKTFNEFIKEKIIF